MRALIGVNVVMFRMAVNAGHSNTLHLYLVAMIQARTPNSTAFMHPG